MSKSQTVKVVVRCRPLNSKELDNGNFNIVTVDQSRGYIAVKNPKPQKSSLDPLRQFTFDRTYSQNSKQQTIFEQTALPILMSVLQGYNGTIFAYGQTGTGKTFTMEGQQSPQHLKGIVPRAIDCIFKQIQAASKNKQYLVRASFLQLYNQQLIDLLAKPEKLKNNQKKKKLQIHERPNEGIKVSGLQQFMIQDRNELTHKYDLGKGHRKVAQTQMNAQSSRSHSIFMIIVENQETIEGKVHTRLGKLNLVDLAGSERQSKTGVTGVERLQAININLSLTTLGLVIQNLVNPKATHIPYRDSLLTRLLQDSLGGNTKTVMIANVGPADYNYDQTLSTLKYAHRAKSIKNDVKINEDPKDALLRQFQEQIKKLREQVANGINGVGEGQTKIVEKIIRIEQGEDIQQIQQKFQKEQEKLKKKYEEQKKKIYLQKNLVEQQKNKLIKQIEQKQNEQLTFKKNQQQLLKKLKKMQMKIHKGEEQEQVARKKQEQLKRKQEEVQQKKRRELQIQEDIKKKEQAILTGQKNYTSLKQENEDKGKRIKHLIQKLKQIQNQNRQLDQTYTAQIDQLQDRRRILQKQLKLKNLILEYFIPSKQLDTLQEKAFWSTEKDQWMLPNLQYSGNSLRLNGQYKPPQRQQNQLQEITKNELQNHPNMYFVYTEDGIARQMDINPNQKKKTKQTKPGSAKRRPQSKPSSKRN